MATITETSTSQDRSHERIRAGHILAQIEQADWEGKTIRRLVCACGWASEWAAAESIGALQDKYALGRFWLPKAGAA